MKTVGTENVVQANTEEGQTQAGSRHTPAMPHVADRRIRKSMSSSATQRIQGRPGLHKTVSQKKASLD